jgi:putative membrane protein
MLWLKAFHIIGVIVWFAGLLYLLRLFVYHASEREAVVVHRFEEMERRLYLYITVPGAYAAILTGAGLLVLGWEVYHEQLWVHIKILLVLVILGIHLYSGYLRKRLLRERDAYSPVFFRVLNEIPTVLLIAVVLLVVLKPF